MTDEPKRFVSARKWRDGTVQFCEWHRTPGDALAWIEKQEQPQDGTWEWCVGEF